MRWYKFISHAIPKTGKLLKISNHIQSHSTISLKVQLYHPGGHCPKRNKYLSISGSCQTKKTRTLPSPSRTPSDRGYPKYTTEVP